MCREMNHKLMCCQIGNKLIYREVSHNLMPCPMDHKLTNVERNEGLLLNVDIMCYEITLNLNGATWNISPNFEADKIPQFTSN